MADPTESRLSGLDGLADGHFHARVAVIHDPAGTPTHLYFVGVSGL